MKKLFRRVIPHSRREKLIVAAALVSALLLLAADQVTKAWFVRNFELYQSIPLVPGWLNFTYVRNLGAAWSMFSGQIWALAGFGIAVALGIIIFFRKLAENCPERYFALLLVISGIAGNSIDRIWRGAVVDFIHVHYYSVWHYPVFNIADVAICCGIGIYLISGFCRKSDTGENNHEKCRS